MNIFTINSNVVLFALLIMLQSLSANASESIQEIYEATAKEPGAIVFTPPVGWKIVDPKELPPSVKVMVVGSGFSLPLPSISLALEPSNKTLSEYLSIVKQINKKKGLQWKDLGKIQTQAGEASLSQVDNISQWGTVRMMHVILEKEGVIYILTAAAPKDDFSKYYSNFCESLRSLRFN